MKISIDAKGRFKKTYTYLKNMKEIKRIETVMDKEFTQDEIEQFVEFLKKYRKVLSTIVDVKLK